MKQIISFRRYLLAKEYSEATAESYSYYAEKFIRHHPNADSYTYQEVTRYLQSEIKRLKSQGSQNAVVAGIKSYYQYLRDIGKRRDNPIEHFRFETKGRRQIQVQDLLTPEELNTVLKLRMEKEVRFVLRNKIILSLLVYQGITTRELVNLTQANFDLDAEKLYLKATRNLNSRTLSLEPSQVHWMLEYLENTKKIRNTPNSPLFKTARGEWITVYTVGSIVKQLRNAVPGKSIDAEIIRQSVIANWLNVRKLPLATAQEMAGHKWTSSTQAYKRIDVEEKRQILNKFHPLG